LGVLTRDFKYRPPGAVENHEYFFTGATRRNYLLRCAALMGVELPVMAARSNEAFVKSARKVDVWKRAAEGFHLSDEDFMADLQDELDKRRNKAAMVRSSWHDEQDDARFGERYWDGSSWADLDSDSGASD